MKALSAFILGIALSGTAPANAMTNNDVTGKMNADQSDGYISGHADMAMAIYRLQGDSTKARCIHDWFYGNAETSTREIYAIFRAYPDKPFSTTMYIIFKKHCGA